MPSLLPEHMRPRDSLRNDLEISLDRPLKTLKEAANFLSASASVITLAIDKFEDASQDTFFPAPIAAPYLFRKTLGEVHAYDVGNEKKVSWVQKQRERILERLDDERTFYPRYALPQ